MPLRFLIRQTADQPSVSIITGAVAVVYATWIWTSRPVTAPAPILLLTVGLVLALTLSFKYPVHIQRGTKVCMGSAALFLIAALAPPGVAVIGATAGVLGGNLMIRSERDLYLSDVATDAARWAIVVLTGSLVAHQAFHGATLHALALLAAGSVLWLGEVVTFPLLVHPMTHDTPWRIMKAIVRETGLTEAAQYLVGLLGALAAAQQLWAVLLLLVPLAPLYLAVKAQKETRETTRQMLETMADAVDLRDPYTGGHSQRVAQYTMAILAEMHLLGPERDLIVAAARVHDIGKIGIPDGVLLKDGQLTPEERALMETHPVHGANLLVRYPDFHRGVAIVRSHHERWDGLGYPDGLKGNDIPYGARIIAVADSFDAMTSDRPYRAGMPVEKALAILRDGQGRQWDAEVVDAFLATMRPSGAVITNRLEPALSPLEAPLAAPSAR